MDIFSIFFKMKVCCVFPLESPHRGDSNEYTQHTIINIKDKKRNTRNIPTYNNVCSYDIFCKGLKNEFETAVVNEPLMVEPLKFYCIQILFYVVSQHFIALSSAIIF